MIFSLLLTLFAQAAESPSLKPGTMDRFLSVATEQLNREQRIQLATHLPKIFRIHFLCQYRAPKAEPVALVPGEWVDSPEGGTLSCPDRYELTLEKQTRMRLVQVGNSPQIFVERGTVTISFGRDLLFLSTPAFELNLAGLGSGQRITLSPDGVECSLGSVRADFEPVGAENPKQLFTSQACRLELALHGGAIKRYLLADDKVQAANLALPRRFWPNLGQPQLAAASAPLGIVLTIPPGQPAGAPFRAQWMIPATLRAGPTCEVYSQSSDALEAVKVTTFKAQASLGELVLDPSYRSASLSMVCDDEKAAYASNVVLQTDPSMPGF